MQGEEGKKSLAHSLLLRDLKVGLISFPSTPVKKKSLSFFSLLVHETRGLVSQQRVNVILFIHLFGRHLGKSDFSATSLPCKARLGIASGEAINWLINWLVLFTLGYMNINVTIRFI